MRLWAAWRAPDVPDLGHKAPELLPGLDAVAVCATVPLQFGPFAIKVAAGQVQIRLGLSFALDLAPRWSTSHRRVFAHAWINKTDAIVGACLAGVQTTAHRSNCHGRRQHETPTLRTPVSLSSSFANWAPISQACGG